MADVFEILVTLNLSAEIPGDELAELRWHLGLGQRPEVLPLTGSFDPEPVLAERGAAWRVGGAVVGELAERGEGWALTALQEVHPDELPTLHALLTGVARHADQVGFAGFVRFYEDDAPQSFTVSGGQLALPAAVTGYL
ncbi:hypothetical protein ACQP2P_02120 [Dactylosporangium sp. CA-139114]|uniref:hypothetical protein n=1 Tax=Dactylosporangium sp. CA-139114 TaxID=3239931 RepID=UPI003D996E1E